MSRKPTLPFCNSSDTPMLMWSDIQTSFRTSDISALHMVLSAFPYPRFVIFTLIAHVLYFLMIVLFPHLVECVGNRIVYHISVSLRFLVFFNQVVNCVFYYWHLCVSFLWYSAFVCISLQHAEDIALCNDPWIMFASVLVKLIEITLLEDAVTNYAMPQATE